MRGILRLRDALYLPPKHTEHTCHISGFHPYFKQVNPLGVLLPYAAYETTFNSCTPFSPSPVCRDTMASADFCQFKRVLLHGLLSRNASPQPSGRPPRVRAIAFIPSTRCIYCMGFGQYWTSFCLANSSAPRQPCIQFLFIEPGLCLQLLSDSTSRWTPLLSANSSYCQAYSGLSPPTYRPCRAHPRKARLPKPGLRDII